MLSSSYNDEVDVSPNFKGNCIVIFLYELCTGKLWNARPDSITFFLIAVGLFVWPGDGPL